MHYRDAKNQAGNMLYELGYQYREISTNRLYTKKDSKHSVLIVWYPITGYMAIKHYFDGRVDVWTPLTPSDFMIVMQEVTHRLKEPTRPKAAEIPLSTKVMAIFSNEEWHLTDAKFNADKSVHQIEFSKNGESAQFTFHIGLYFIVSTGGNRMMQTTHRDEDEFLEAARKLSVA